MIPCIVQCHPDIPVNENLALELAEIPYNDVHSRSSNSGLRLDRDNSLYNAIEAFPPHQLRLLRCEGVTDRFLNWLSGDDYAALEAPKMEVITLHDCSNFTSRGICNLLLRRHKRIERDGAHSTVSTLTEVEVLGTGPAIHEDDLAILENRTLDQTALHVARVCWKVERSNSHESASATDLTALASGDINMG